MSLYDDTMAKIAEELNAVSARKEGLLVQVSDLQERINKMNAEICTLDARAVSLTHWRKTFLDSYELLSKLTPDTLRDVISEGTADIVADGKFDVLNDVVTSDKPVEADSFTLGYLPAERPAEIETEAEADSEGIEGEADIMPDPEDLFVKEAPTKELVTHFSAGDLEMIDLIRSKRPQRQTVFGKGAELCGYIYDGKVTRLEYPKKMRSATKCLVTLSQLLADKYGSVEKVFERLTEEGGCSKNRSTGEVFDLRVERDCEVVMESNPGSTNAMVRYAIAPDGVLYGLEFPYYITTIVSRMFKHLVDDLADGELITTSYKEEV